MIAMDYGTIYVASVAMGAKDEHTLKAFMEAEAYDGPAIIIAYSHCIAHGINMTNGLQDQKAAVQSGQWLLYRFNPDKAAAGENPLHLDSAAPTIKVADYFKMENRFRLLAQSEAREAGRILSRHRSMSTSAGNATNTWPHVIYQPPTEPTHESVHHLSGAAPANAPCALGLALTENPDNIKRMEDAGAAAIVFHSLFEEQIRLER